MKRFHQIAIALVSIAICLYAIRHIYQFDFDRPPDWQGKATVIDGDTFILAKQRIRLFGIDAPELDNEPFGALAKAYLSDLLESSLVQCYDTGQRSYNRAVARCFDDNGFEVSATMVAHGYAQDMPRFSKGAYLPNQIAAELAGKGLHALQPDDGN